MNQGGPGEPLRHQHIPTAEALDMLRATAMLHEPEPGLFNGSLPVQLRAAGGRLVSLVIYRRPPSQEVWKVAVDVVDNSHKPATGLIHRESYALEVVSARSGGGAVWSLSKVQALFDGSQPSRLVNSDVYEVAAGLNQATTADVAWLIRLLRTAEPLDPTH